MRCLLTGAVVVSMVAALGGCAAAPAGDRWADLVAPEVLAQASLEYYWKCQLPLSADEQVVNLWRLDENLYALTSENRLLAVDAVQGRAKWMRAVGRPTENVFAPCHADRVMLPQESGIAALLDPTDITRVEPFAGLVINTFSRALLIRRDSGELVRTFELGFSANSPGSCDGTHFYVGAVSGRYYAIRLSEGLNAWVRATGDMIYARPTLFNRKLYVASADGRFYVVDPSRGDGPRAWLQRTDGPISAQFVVDPRGCFVPSQDFNLYAYDTVTGALLWAFRTQGPLRHDVQVGQRSAFQYADADRFYAVDLARGEQRWELADGRLVVAVVEPHVLVLTHDRRLLRVHESLGEVKLSLPMTGLELFVPNADLPVIYAGTADGRLVCLRPAGAEKLTEEMLKD